MQYKKRQKNYEMQRGGVECASGSVVIRFAHGDVELADLAAVIESGHRRPARLFSAESPFTVFHEQRHRFAVSKCLVLFGKRLIRKGAELADKLRLLGIVRPVARPVQIMKPLGKIKVEVRILPVDLPHSLMRLISLIQPRDKAPAERADFLKEEQREGVLDIVF